MKAVSYIRVSTDEQANEGHSLDAQRAIIGDFCLNRELDPRRRVSGRRSVGQGRRSPGPAEAPGRRWGRPVRLGHRACR